MTGAAGLTACVDVAALRMFAGSATASPPELDSHRVQEKELPETAHL